MNQGKTTYLIYVGGSTLVTEKTISQYINGCKLYLTS